VLSSLERLGSLASLDGKRVAIVGAGREGVSTCAFLRECFPALPLTLADQSYREHLSLAVLELARNDPHLALLTGEDYLSHLENFDVIFRSPGIPPDLPQFEAAKARGAWLTSNSDLFFRLCPAPVVGVTGTKGKSTTASLIAAILARGSKTARLVGNIGVPPLSALGETTPDMIVVAELSSYQLADMQQSPHIAVLLNIVPEHLSYHKTFAAYVEAKANLARHQHEGEYCIFNADHALPAQLAHNSPATKIGFSLQSPENVANAASAANVTYRLEGSWLVDTVAAPAEKLVHVDDITLPGQFNLQNVLPALAVGRLCGVAPAAMREAVREFRPLAHRLEWVGTVGGVRFYNDSLSTVPEAAVAAIETLTPAPIVLIAGGHERGLDYAPLARKLLEVPIRCLVLFPPSGERIWRDVVALCGENHAPPAAQVGSMREAVGQAWSAAQPGDVVLLSPASASFSLFVDYHDRGEQFRAEVGRLAADSLAN
jgi:UDP-N-acetylmuramoylalanine--D-glutamate ligase